MHDADAGRIAEDLKRFGEDLRLRDGYDLAFEASRTGVGDRWRCHN